MHFFFGTGTGKSTPITKQSLEERFPDLFLLDDKEESDLDQLASSYPDEHQKFSDALKEATEYMASFRADNIVLVRHRSCYRVWLLQSTVCSCAVLTFLFFS